jgi:hypothetical protein
MHVSAELCLLRAAWPFLLVGVLVLFIHNVAHNVAYLLNVQGADLPIIITVRVRVVLLLVLLVATSARW